MNNIKIISAGAGSGKTYRLTEEMTALLVNKEVSAAGIIATTFTKKAAAELKERVRIKLLGEGLSREANELSNALIGTVHGLGVKLLQRFCFEAGVSPQVEIIPDEDHQRLFNLSMAAVIDVPTVERMELLIDRLGLTANFGQPYDWRKEIREVVEVIRANDFDNQQIERSKQKSWENFVAFLPPPDGRDRAAANNGLLTLLDSTQLLLENNEVDQTKTTLSAAQQMRNLHRELQRKQYLSWPQWAGLSKPKVGAKSRELVEDIATYAGNHLAFSCFQNDVRDFIALIFDCAKATIHEYSDYKKRRGQIDYTDMEVLVLRLLDHPTVNETLREELDLLMVDEFQDTSPIQLAIFLRLSKLAKQSIWVGDPKQSIYGFRGAEPRLMAAVIKAAGGVKPANIQEHSYRSREDLVYLTNDLFTRAFPDLPIEEVRLLPKRTRAGNELSPAESAEQQSTSGLWHWHFEMDGKGRVPKVWKYGMIGKALAELLANPPLIRPKGSKKYRPLQAADIAVLCRSNYGCLSMATALYEAGTPAAVAREGLLSTAEGVLMLACLKYMLNGEDSLSVSEIRLLASREPIEAIIDDRLDYLEKIGDDDKKRYEMPPWGDHDQFIQQLDAMREATQEYAPAELLNHLLERLDLRRIIVAWGNGEQRLSNIDEFRRLALAYEENCHRLQQAASVGGLLLYLDGMARAKMDKQGAGERAEAVNVLTYHRSKGLEWPIVVCNDLDQPMRAELWGRYIVSEAMDIDIDQPLANRWLRYWVNPYAKSGNGLTLTEALQESHWQEEKNSEAAAEEARLLYVGITRARDYLILPTSKDGAPWLDRVYGTEAVLDPHSDQAPFLWDGHEVDKRTQSWTEPKTLTVADMSYQAIPFLREQRPGPQDHLPAEVTVEMMAAHFPNGAFDPNRLAVYYSMDAAISPELYTNEYAEVVAAFLAADRPTLPAAERLEIANNLLRRFAIPEVATAEALLQRSDAFQRSLSSDFSSDAIRLNLPLCYQEGPHRYFGNLDMVVDTPDGAVLINHCALAVKNWDKKLAGQLAEGAYRAKVASQLLAAPPLAAYYHLPLQGALYRVDEF